MTIDKVAELSYFGFGFWGFTIQAWTGTWAY